jgi:hypothetical protein
MRKFSMPAVCLAVVLGVPAATPALAFGYGCGWGAVECYDKVRLPDVYAVRTRPIVLSPAWREVVPTPPIVRNYAVPVEVRPGRWRTHVYPPVYGMKLQRVLVAPAGRTYEEIPAVTRRVRKTVVVSPGGFRWEHRRGLFGHERLCKVRVAPVTRTVVREVVVSPARRVAHVRRPIYRNVLRPVLIRPATAERVYEPPIHAVLNRPVVVRPAGVQIYDHPPVVGVAEERVLVHEGGYAWKPSRRLFGRW